MVRYSQEEKNSLLKMEVLGRMFLGHQVPRHRDIPDPGPGMFRTKLYAMRQLFLVFKTGHGPRCGSQR